MYHHMLIYYESYYHSINIIVTYILYHTYDTFCIIQEYRNMYHRMIHKHHSMLHIVPPYDTYLTYIFNHARWYIFCHSMIHIISIPSTCKRSKIPGIICIILTLKMYYYDTKCIIMIQNVSYYPKWEMYFVSYYDT